MPLIDREGLERLYGEPEITQLAPADAAGEARLADAITRAQAEIDSRLGHRYQLPLPATTELVEAAGVLVRARLYIYDPPEWLTDEAAERRRYLDEAAQGKRTLLGLEPRTASPPTATTVESLRGRRDRRMTREALRDY